MSDQRREVLLGDLLELAAEAEGYVVAWTRDAYLADAAKQRALERVLELMGEVATRLGDDAPEGVTDWKSLRELRILLAHAYHRVDARRLWLFAAQDVPALRAALGGP